MSNMPKQRAVEMVDLFGKVVKTYSSLAEAGRDNYMTRQHIRNHCIGNVKNPFDFYDYTFRYKG